jgi:long-chain fatty acid transport protein
MKKIVTSLAVALAATSAFAGGLLTTTSQNAHYLRFFSQDADINLTSLYANPAGQAFLNKGWHISASAMTAMQSRNINSTLPLFAKNADGLTKVDGSRDYEGDAFAPIIPSFDVAYVQDKWSVSAHFGVVAGGGTCEFENGLGVLEGVAAEMAYKNGASAYSLDSYLKGKQNYFGFQIGATYKILDNLSAYAGVRGVFASCAYEGYLKNLNFKFVTPAGTMDVNPLQQVDPANEGVVLDCSQSDFGVTPILGIHYTPIKGLDIAAKYEFRTRVGLNNETTFSTAAQALGQMNPKAAAFLDQYADGKEIRNDIPALLTVGAQYRPIENLKIAASWHYFFDKSTVKYGDRQNLIDGNTMEFLAGVEWKFCKWVAASASWQNTIYDLSDAYLNDVDFTMTNHSLGLGVRIYPCKLLNIDLGYMHTFYQDRTVEPSQANPIKNTYSRTNDVVGIGLNFAF